MPNSTTTSSATSTFGTVLPTGTISAPIGSPPATSKEYYIATFILLAFGGENTAPLLGAFIPPARPSDYIFETKGPKIIASMSIVIAVIFIVTGLRLAVCLLQGRLVVDWDDVFIVPGVVSLSHIHLSPIYECLPLPFL
jgi:hypothetical protein